MRRTLWTVAVAAGVLSVIAFPLSGAQAACVDTEETRTGVLRWAVLAAAFSGSSAIATRSVDLEPDGGGCLAVHVRCLAEAADGSFLQVDVYPGGAAYTASFRGLLVVEDGAARCGSARDFQGSNGVLHVAFSG